MLLLMLLMPGFRTNRETIQTSSCYDLNWSLSYSQHTALWLVTKMMTMMIGISWRQKDWDCNGLVDYQAENDWPSVSCPVIVIIIITGYNNDNNNIINMIITSYRNDNNFISYDNDKNIIITKILIWVWMFPAHQASMGHGGWLFACQIHRSGRSNSYPYLSYLWIWIWICICICKSRIKLFAYQICLSEREIYISVCFCWELC